MCAKPDNADKKARKQSTRPSPKKPNQPAPLDADPEPPLTPAGCPIVGIGASAGGLEALKQFFDAMPPDSGAAFVLIQHLDPTHESLTAELLSRHTQMSVMQVDEPMSVQANHVYVIPPNRYLSIAEGMLIPTEPTAPRGVRMAVDFFLRSLAQHCMARAVGIVFSGSGTDGTLGLKEVRARGGLTLAQQPETAQHEWMPRSAIASGSVDQVLPIEQMPDVIARYISHDYIRTAAEDKVPTAEAADILKTIVAILRTHAKFDFSCYKKGTLIRRIHRRMSLRHLDQLEDYARLLRDQPKEVTALFEDLLINVTSFFREPDAWDALRDLVVDPLVSATDISEPIRVWVPACASGEEAYSIGMLLIEQLQAAHNPRPLQIFASDVDANALAYARAGEFPESIAADVAPERLRRFFTKGDNRFRISKELREAVIFAQQNVLADPPFSKLDLICCRNLMIYLETDVQKRILELMHFALNDRGCLFLGTAESIGVHDDLFETVSKKWRIYRRIGHNHTAEAHFPIIPSERERFAVPAREFPTHTSSRLGTNVQQLLVDRYAPTCVLINRKYEIVYYVGNTQDYLVQPAGTPTRDLLSSARDTLHIKLRSAVHKAIREDRTVNIAGIRVKRGKTSHRVRVTVEPITGIKDMAGLLLVSFEDEVQPAAAADQPSAAAPADAADESTLDQVEAELRATRNDLQSTVEELEASNEELKAANEEVMSINEELQSTNEELETSKEELQSLNEELSTVNSQLENKITELESANDDLHNLHVNTDVATLFLDTRFRIRRFTPAMTRLLNLIPADIGRPLSDFATPVNSDDLLKVATEVLDRLVPADAEVRTDDRWYLRRVLPYRTADNRIDGVVITYTDITTAKKDEAKIRQLNKDLEERVTKRTRELESAIRGVRETRDHLAAILANTADGIIIIDPAGTIQSFNPAAEMIFGYSADEVVGKNVQRLMPEPFAAEHTEYIGNYLRTGKARIIGIGREVLARRKDGSTVPIDLRIAELRRDDEHLFIGSIRDLTLTKEREADMRMLQAQLAELTARERRRIGLDLHDHVGQSIAASAMVASTLEHKLRSAGSDEADAAAELVTQMREAHSQVREIAKGLAPVMTPDQNIATALAELAKRTHAVHHLACDFASNGKVTIKSLDVTDHLYHIAAESVSNAIRHARASHIHIALTRDDQNLTMIVRDDGVGLPPNHKMQAGIGMNIMRYRANVIGAQLDITPAEGGGTQVRCVLPIPNRE